MVVTVHRFLCATLLIALGACLEEPASPEVDATSGALRLHCKQDEIEVGEVGYTIARGGATIRTGKFDIDESKQTFSVVIGPLPVDTNYTINLQALAVRTRSGASSECSGESAFAVAPKQTTVVGITLRCGGVSKRGKNNNQCPRIDSVRATPWEVKVGSSVTLRGDAHDMDRNFNPLRFLWSAREGLLTAPTESRCSYKCTGPGRPAITFKVSDGDDTCPEESVTVFINCKKPSTAAAGGSAIPKPCSPASLLAGRGAAGANGSSTGCAGSSGTQMP